MNLIPVKPEDDLFPTHWPGMNDFIRAFTVGGDLMMTTITKHPNGHRYEGKESVICAHADMQAKFQVTRLDAVTFVVKRTT